VGSISECGWRIWRQRAARTGVARPTCTGFQFVGIREIRVKAFCVSLQLKTAVFICVHPWLNSAPRPILDGEGEARLLREFSVKSTKTGAFSR